MDVSAEGTEKDMVSTRILREEGQRRKNSPIKSKRVFIVMGDSTSDLLLAKPFFKVKAPFTFYFTGVPNNQFKKDVIRVFGCYPRGVFIAPQRFTRGTLKVLGHEPKRVGRPVLHRIGSATKRR